jgi:uncharacterized protein YraI
MTLKKTVLTVGLAVIALAGSAASALAASAYATSNVNVRSGPGGGYEVVDNLRRGERVEIDRCRGNWCLVYGRSTEGWVSASYLGDRARPSRVQRRVEINLGIGSGYVGRYDNWDRGDWDRRDRRDWDRGDRRGRDWDRGYRSGDGVDLYIR